MKSIFVLIATLSASIPCIAGEDCIISDIEGFAEELALSFSKGSLSEFNKVHCFGTRAHVVIEHSISDEVAETHVNSLAEMESWLDSHKSEGLPAPGFWPLSGCKEGLCIFSDNQKHNHIFLKEIHYSVKKKGLVISTIIFEDGD